MCSYLRRKANHLIMHHSASEEREFYLEFIRIVNQFMFIIMIYKWNFVMMINGT
jgi:hypothetical protein